MAQTKYSDSPSVCDSIIFDLETTSNDLLEDAKIDAVVISFIRQTPGKFNSYIFNMFFYDPLLEKQYKDKQTEPKTEENIKELKFLKQKLDLTAKSNQFCFNDIEIVYNVPLELLKKISEGRFSFEWNPSNIIEGNYLVFWKWTTKDGKKLSKQEIFQLSEHKEQKTSNPIRYSSVDKYLKLMDFYTPKMYKRKIHPEDITPFVVKQLTSCVAEGFSLLEDSANQLFDILDASLVKENILPLLANNFSLKLYSSDPNKWRRQISRAIPLAKSKGTLPCLVEALDQAGIKLLKLTKLWQIVSEYKWTEAFYVKTDLTNVLGNLSYIPINNNIEVKLRSGKDYIKLPSECIRLVEPLDKSKGPIVVWQGETVNNDLKIFEKDLIVITYNIKQIPKERKAAEDYLQSLPLADTRENNNLYPLKNWNVKVIEEDDPLFHALIPERFPFVDYVVFGKIRTNFLYSEKTYNMDTFDGSLRDSKHPCDIDKEFIDRCSYCQSSKFNVDIEMEELSDDRINEAKEIIKEYSPFHAILHSMNISGKTEDFIVFSEDIEILVDTKKPANSVKEDVSFEEEIHYEIEYKDGSKEEGKI